MKQILTTILISAVITTIDTMGETGGEDEHVQTEAEMFAHSHSINSFGAGAANNDIFINKGENSITNISTNSRGSSEAFNVLDPFLVLRYIIKY